MVKPTRKNKEPIQKPLSKEALELIDHIAAILAEEFVKAIKQHDEKKEDEEDESRDLC